MIKIKKDYVIYSFMAIISIYCVFATIKLTYAADNNSNTIYTRDELSEKVEEYDKRTEFFALVYDSSGETTYPTETELNDMGCWGRSPSNSISCDNSTLTIEKSGLYRFSVYGWLTFSGTPAASYIIVTVNNNNWISLPFESTSLGQSLNDFSTILALNQGENMKVKMLSISPILAYRAVIELEYVGK